MKLHWLVVMLGVAMAVAAASHAMLHNATVIFLSSAVALVLLSKYMGDATEHLSGYVGERTAGFLNVSLGNLAELIIIYVAVSENQIDLVQAGIVGSIMGNILLTMGASIYLGCRRNGTLYLNHDEAVLLINQFFLVGGTLMLPTFFQGVVPEHNLLPLSYTLAIMLVAAYLYYHVLSVRDPRFKAIARGQVPMDNTWSRNRSVTVLVACSIGAFGMSKLLVGEVDAITQGWGVSRLFIGFIVLPLLGNIAERSIAIIAARKKMVELSLAISIGSASQVGMIIAPGAVLFGWMTGNAVTLSFTHLPLAALVLSLVAGYLVLQDDRWNVNEGIMLLAFYGAIVTAFFFTG